MLMADETITRQVSERYARAVTTGEQMCCPTGYNFEDLRAFVPEEVVRASDWHERVEAAHREGYAAVGGSIENERGFLRKQPPKLAPYARAGGRNPAFAHPLVCPSLLPPLEPNAEVMGLPAWRPEGDEPWIYDARITVTLPPRRRLRPPT